MTIANGSDFDDFAGIEHRPSRAVPDHPRGQLLRQARPAAVPDRARRVRPRRRRPLRRRLPAGRPRVGRGLGLGDRLELIPYVPRRRSLELQRDSEALLLLIPEAGGPRAGVLSGKVFEYLAAERPILAVVPPDGAAAALIRETGAGVVAPPDDVGGDPRGARGPATRAGRPGELDGDAARPRDAAAPRARGARRGARRAAAEPCMSRRLDGGDQGAQVPALPAPERA